MASVALKDTSWAQRDSQVPHKAIRLEPKCLVVQGLGFRVCRFYDVEFQKALGFEAYGNSGNAF